MSGTAFRGVSADQDPRFGNKEKKLLKSLAKTFPVEYNQKPNLQNVNWESMKPWIARRITELLNGVEDDVLIGYVIEEVEGKKKIDPRILQINLTGFLEKNASLFCKELWNLLLSAAETPSGIPQKFLDEKAKEIEEREAERQRLQERIQQRRRHDGRGRDVDKRGDRTSRRRSRSVERYSRRQSRSWERRDGRDSRRYDSRSHSRERRYDNNRRRRRRRSRSSSRD